MSSLHDAARKAAEEIQDNTCGGDGFGEVQNGQAPVGPAWLRRL
jgi:hypothetical protein